MALDREERALKILRRNFSDLCEDVSHVLPEFANKVFEKDLISQSNCREAQNSTKDVYERSSTLLHLLLERMKRNPCKFSLFLEILKTFPTMKHSVETLEMEPETVTSKDSVSIAKHGMLPLTSLYTIKINGDHAVTASYSEDVLAS